MNNSGKKLAVAVCKVLKPFLMLFIYCRDILSPYCKLSHVTPTYPVVSRPTPN